MRGVERASIQRFQIESQAGVGGMGQVFRAFDPQLQRVVAIKVLHGSDARVAGELSSDHTLDLNGGPPSASPDSLLQEARMMARLSHPNVVPVYEVGLDGAAVFVVMEHIAGTDLATWLASPRTNDEILAVFAQASHGLAAAHARGIIHRDFKPANVLIGDDGRVRVSDFGLSRLHAPAASMVRVADVGGTPFYMAPELWRGSPATPATDVYAFCVALIEALGADPKAELTACDQQLRARGIATRLRGLLVAGVTEDPARRPGLDQIGAELEGRTPRRGLLVGAAAVALVAASGVGVILAVTTHEKPPVAQCSSEPASVEGHWTPALRVQLAGALARSTTGPTGDARIADVSRLLSAFDARAVSLADYRHQVCEASVRGAITPQQAEQRMGCVDRRAIELGAIARSGIHAERPNSTDTELRLHALWGETCDELASPPVRDHAGLLAAYDRFHHIYTITDAEGLADAITVEREAAALGDSELASRAAILQGSKLRQLDRVPESLATLDRAYQLSLAVGCTTCQLMSLTERSTTEGWSGNHQAAKSTAQLAQGLVDRPGVSFALELRVIRAQGRAHLNLGEYAEAVAVLRPVVARLATTSERYALWEILIRTELTDSLLFGGGTVEEALALAKETVERSRLLLGEDALNTAVAENQVAKVYSTLRDDASALPHRRAALAIMLRDPRTAPSQVSNQRAELAQTLYYLNKVEQARGVYAEVVAAAESNAALRKGLPVYRAQLAKATFALGQYDEGIELYEQAIVDANSVLGYDHSKTLIFRIQYADRLLEVGRYRDSAKAIDAIEKAYRKRGKTADKRSVAELQGTFRAAFALASKQFDEAEQLTRGALATQIELGAAPESLWRIRYFLGWSLAARGKYAEAMTELARARSDATTVRERENSLAMIDATLARVELGLGLTDAARARAHSAARVLSRYPGDLWARRDADAVLALLPR